MRFTVAVITALVLAGCGPDGTGATSLGRACVADDDCSNVYRCLDTEASGRICTVPCGTVEDCRPAGPEEICPLLRCRGRFCVSDECPG